MYKSMIIVIFFLMFIALMACDFRGPNTEEVNVGATVIEQADVFDTLSMATKWFSR